MTEQLAAPTAEILRVTAPTNPGDVPGSDSVWEYTQMGIDVAKLRRQGERSAGRPERETIGRDTRVAEGVYEGRYGGEAIVVDYDRDPELIDETVQAALMRATIPGTNRVIKSAILDGVFDEVSQRMRYDSAAVESIFDDQLGGKHGHKISLSNYIQEGVGECRHQALFAGIVLEQLKDRGVINGNISVDRNLVRRGPDGKYDGHAWVRYTNSAGAVYIMDIAQQRIELLQTLMEERDRDPEMVWDYARPEDKQKQIGQLALNATGAQTYKRSTYTDENGVIDRLPWDN